MKKEHRIFSAYFKASFPEYANGIVSSLVWGDDFIHMYTVNLLHESFPMIAHTYFKHGNPSFLTMWFGDEELSKCTYHLGH